MIGESLPTPPTQPTQSLPNPLDSIWFLVCLGSLWALPNALGTLSIRWLGWPGGRGPHEASHSFVFVAVGGSNFAVMPPRAISRSRTPPTRGYWDHHRARKEKERELAEQDAMYLEDPHTLDWWVRSRETVAMARHDDWHLLYPGLE